MQKRLLLGAMVLALAACGRHDEQPADTIQSVQPPSADSARVADSLKRADTLRPTTFVVPPLRQLYSLTERALAVQELQAQSTAVVAPEQPQRSHKWLWVGLVLVLIVAGIGWLYWRAQRDDEYRYSASSTSRRPIGRSDSERRDNL